MAEIAVRQIVAGPGQQPAEALLIVGHQRKKQPVALPFRRGYLLRGGRVYNPPIIADHVLLEVFPGWPDALARALRRPCQDWQNRCKQSRPGITHRLILHKPDDDELPIAGRARSGTH
ncbi:hypothetical protein D9M71_650120 [compost metagenome]